MSLKGHNSIPVPSSCTSTRLDIFLSSELRLSHTRSSIAQLCDGGQVMVNGKVQNKGYKLRANDVVLLCEKHVTTSSNEAVIVPEKIDLEILYELLG